MTVKEREKINQIVSRTDVTGNERAELIAEFTKQFALQVATEAVEEEVESWGDHPTSEDAEFHGNEILKNIKKRLE